MLSGIFPMQVLFFDDPVLLEFDLTALPLQRVYQILVLVNFHLVLILKILGVCDLSNALKDHVQLTFDKLSLDLAEFFVLVQLEDLIILNVA